MNMHIDTMPYRSKEAIERIRAVTTIEIVKVELGEEYKEAVVEKNVTEKAVRRCRCLVQNFGKNPTMLRARVRR